MSEPQAETEATPVLSVPEIVIAATATQAISDEDPNADERFMEFVSHSLGDMIAGHLDSVSRMLPLGPNGERLMISSQFADLRTLAGELRVLASLIDTRIPLPKATTEVVENDSQDEAAAEQAESTLVHS